MTKSIYGIFDTRSHNFGDICILDRDEEFRDGCISLLSNPDIPDYVVMDLVCVRYGSVTFDSSQLYPKFYMDPTPTVIVYGSDVCVSRSVKEDVSRETNLEDN